MVKNPPAIARVRGLIPGWGTKILHAAGVAKENNKVIGRYHPNFVKLNAWQDTRANVNSSCRVAFRSQCDFFLYSVFSSFLH